MYAGVSILSKKLQGFLKNKFYSFEKDYAPNLIKKICCMVIMIIRILLILV